MALLKLFLVFFQVGLFTIGGGLVAIPILQEYVDKYEWVSQELFVDMIAVSQSTPGPIGVNMATYVGFTQFGIIGSIIATMGMVTPSLIIIYIISKFLKLYKDNHYVKGVLSGVRPVVVGLILAAAYYLSQVTFFSSGTVDIVKVIFFIIIFALIVKYKKHPLIYLAIGAIVGILLF